ncbi:MAG TPA: polysaccharide biosynthesis/export family protein [Pseudolabrys sp.]|jgi:polysaccharide export outer membrane protein
MRKSRLLLATVVALAAASCARQQQTYVIDPATGQPVPVMAQQSYAQAPQAPAGGDRGLFGSQSYAQPQYAAPQYAQQSYAQQTYQQPAAQPAPPPNGRGLFNSSSPAPQVYGQPQVQQPYVLQYTPPRAAAPQYAAPQYVQPQYAQPQYVAPGGAYASASPYEQPYTLDAGDKLRIVVFGQDGISNAYVVDAGGNVNLPLIGTVPARGATTGQLSQRIAERLKQGFVREPHVTVEVEAYRPFFILGEVTNPGQYPYVADMTVEKAIAIAGGFAPRASHSNVEITRNVPGQQFKGQVPLTFPMRPGDTVVVKERWF